MSSTAISSLQKYELRGTPGIAAPKGRVMSESWAASPHKMHASSLMFAQIYASRIKRSVTCSGWSRRASTVCTSIERTGVFRNNRGTWLTLSCLESDHMQGRSGFDIPNTVGLYTTIVDLKGVPATRPFLKYFSVIGFDGEVILLPLCRSPGWRYEKANNQLNFD